MRKQKVDLKIKELQKSTSVETAFDSVGKRKLKVSTTVSCD